MVCRRSRRVGDHVLQQGDQSGEEQFGVGLVDARRVEGEPHDEGTAAFLHHQVEAEPRWQSQGAVSAEVSVGPVRECPVGYRATQVGQEDVDHRSRAPSMIRIGEPGDQVGGVRRVRETVQIRPCDLAQGCRKRPVDVDVIAQQHGSGQHSDGARELCRVPSGDNGSDDHIGVIAQACQQDGQCGMHGHECRSVVCRRLLTKPLVLLGGELDFDRRARSRFAGRRAQPR